MFQWIWQLHGKLKQIGVNKIVWIQVNEDVEKWWDKIIYNFFYKNPPKMK